MFKEIKQKLIEALSNLEAKEEFKSKVYSDKEISVSQKTVGAKVEMIGTDGSLSPAKDGDYQLEDGTKFTVKETLIASIEGEKMEEKVEGSPAEEATETPADTVKEDVDVVAIKQSITDLQAQIEALKGAVDELKNASASKEDANKFSSQLDALTDAIKALDTTPVEFSAVDKRAIEVEAKDEKMKNIASVFAKINAN